MLLSQVKHEGAVRVALAGAGRSADIAG